MGVYRRKDSVYYWMTLERPGLPRLRKSTGVLVDAPTVGQRRDQRQRADQIYSVAMGELARTGYKIPADRPAIGFKEFAKWYEENVAEHHRGKSKELSNIRQLVREFADTPLAAIERGNVQEWMTRRRKSVSAATVNRELDVLKLMLAAAVPRYLAANPLTGLRRLRRDEREIRVLTREEYDRLIDKANDEEKALVVTAVNTLLRLSSLLRLEWQHDKGKYFITLNAKVSQVLAPINRATREALDAIPRGADTDVIFARGVGRRGGGPTARHNYVIRQFEQLCDRADVPHGRHVNGVTFHSLRHTGATWALAKTGNLKAVMALGGWKTVPVCLQYVHALSDDVAKAAEAISRGASVVSMKNRG
jgi:integrase